VLERHATSTRSQNWDAAKMEARVATLGVTAYQSMVDVADVGP
jgi:hypothetical protein